MIFKSILFTLLLVPGIVQGQGSADGTDVDETEQMVQELEQQKKQQAAMALAIEKSKEDMQKVGAGALQDLQKQGKLNLNSLGNMDEKAVEFLQQQLRAAHMSSLPREQVKNAILSKTEGKPLGKIFQSFPSLLEFCVDFIRHDEALPSLLGILNKKEDMKKYFYVWIGMILFSFLVKRYVFPKSWVGFKRFMASTALTLSVTAISLGTFYYLFQKELAPTVSLLF